MKHKKIILRVLVILLSGILVLMALNYRTIRHAYYGINLFNTSKLSDSSEIWISGFRYGRWKRERMSIGWKRI